MGGRRVPGGCRGAVDTGAHRGSVAGKSRPNEGVEEVGPRVVPALWRPGKVLPWRSVDIGPVLGGLQVLYQRLFFARDARHVFGAEPGSLRRNLFADLIVEASHLWPSEPVGTLHDNGLSKA